tara:strand:+ start:1427 stop:1912 length:486 start_codon:yes stop_codon:yes gene_type:complete
MAWRKLTTVDGDGTAAYSSDVFVKRKFISIMKFTQATTSLNDESRLGNTTIDTGTNYATRSSQNGAAEDLLTSRTSIIDSSATSDAGEIGFNITNIINISLEEKLIIAFRIDNVATGAGTAPNNREIVGKWVSTDQLNIVGAYSATGTYNSNSNISVLGTD